jgi:predicted phosphohydrolase
LSCQSQIEALDIKWSNQTAIDEVVADLKKKCRTLPLSKRKMCDALVDVLVQIPPAIFDGMDDLAWPVPLAPCALIRQCKVNCCAPDSPPEQIHLSLAHNDNTVMGVSWVTLDQRVSVVQFGDSPDKLDRESTGTIGTYTSAGWVGTIHRATMTGLEEGRTYFYRVGNGASSWSDIFEFRTLKTGQDITFGVVADMAYDSNSDHVITALAELARQGKVDAMIHSGDISYADGFEPHWDDFFNKIQPLAARVPYMVAPGNHEFWFNFSSYKARVFMPGTLDQGGSGDNMYYSWIAGPVHFLAMNSETAIDTANFNDAELAWAQNELDNVDRTKTPFVIAHFHRPMYCSGDNDCDKFATLLKDEAEDMFYNGKVSVVITGHIHGYERTLPVYKGASTNANYNSPSAPVHIMQGASGNREGNDGVPSASERAEWSAAYFNEIGFALMSVTQSSIDWKYFAAIGGTEIKQLDQIVITK